MKDEKNVENTNLATESNENKEIINNTNETEKHIETEVLDNKCPCCGAKIDFNPKTGTFICEFCRKETTLEEMKKYQNASNEQNNKSVSEENVDNYEDYVVYKCKNCGAEIVADAETTATFCVYCRNTAILKNKLSGKFAPDYIIPFSKAKEEAEKAFISLSKNRPLVPKDFTDKTNIEKIRGIYIPFWFHTFYIDGEIIATGKNYTHWSVGDTHYTKTDVYKIIRDGSATFKNVPIDGSKRFPDDLMNTIQPYDYNKIVPYNHAYLSGFLAERYDVEGEITKAEIEPKVLLEAKNQFLNTSKTLSQINIKSNTLKTKEYSIKYALLPVYMVNIKYGGKMYTFAMNGQTGEFIGNIPVDKKKAIIIGVLTFTVLFLILWGISFILFEVAKWKR